MQATKASFVTADEMKALEEAAESTGCRYEVREMPMVKKGGMGMKCYLIGLLSMSVHAAMGQQAIDVHCYTILPAFKELLDRHVKQL